MRLHRLINIAHDLIAVNILRGQELPALAGRDWARHIRYAALDCRNDYGYPVAAVAPGSPRNR